MAFVFSRAAQALSSVETAADRRLLSIVDARERGEILYGLPLISFVLAVTRPTVSLSWKGASQGLVTVMQR